MIKVSFCLPTYNVKKYLEKCIKSIFDQNLDKNTYEILCCEDCSTDDSLQELKRLQSIYPNIHIFQNEINRGLSFSRNKLIENAKGDYIFFLDTDDMLYPNSIGKMLDLAYSLDADILAGQYVAFADGTEYKFPAFYNDTEIVVEKTDMANATSVCGKKENISCAILFKRTYIISNNLFFNTNLYIHEDVLLTYRTAFTGGKKYKCNIVCYMYCQRATSIMHHLRTEERQKKVYLSKKEIMLIYKHDLETASDDYHNFIFYRFKHERLGAIITLAHIQDKKFIKSQLKELKKEKIYPYKLDFSVFKEEGTFAIKLLLFLLSIKPLFWIFRKMFIRHNKNKNSSIK